jgi:hypothetical protein
MRVPYVIRRKRRIRIPLSYAWEAVNPMNWDVFAPKPPPDNYRKWAEHKMELRAKREAALSEPSSHAAPGQHETGGA